MQLDHNKSNDSTHAQDVSKDARVFDVEKLAREQGFLIEHWLTKPPKTSLLYCTPEQLRQYTKLVLEEAAKAFSDHSKEGREWVRGSLWDTLTNEGCARIRALAEGVR